MKNPGFVGGSGALPLFAPSLVLAATEQNVARSSAAIVAVDVVGYSALMEADDVGTARRLRVLRGSLLEPAARFYGGNIFSVAGDGAMASFITAKAAIACAVAIKRRLNGAHAPWGLRLRMGVSYGSVIRIGRELYGSPLNVAARLEACAGPDEVVVSEAAVERARGLQGIRFVHLGEWRLSKMDVPCSAYRAF